MPKNKTVAPEVLISIQKLKPLIELIPPLGHFLITRTGEIPAPITYQLLKHVPENKFLNLIPVDTALRMSLEDCRLSYAAAIDYIDVQLLATKTILECYGVLQPFYPDLTPFEKFIVCHANLLKAKLEFYFEYVNTLNKKTHSTQLNEIKETFVKAMATIQYFEKIIEVYADFFSGPNLQSRVFCYYQTMLEVILSKVDILNIKDKVSLQTLGADSLLEKLHAILLANNEPGTAMAYHMLNAKVALTIKHQMNKALEHIQCADTVLKNTSPSDMQHQNHAEFNNHITSLRLGIRFEHVRANQITDIAAIHAAVSMANDALETLALASPSLKHQFLVSYTELASYFLKIVDARLKFANLNELTDLVDKLKSVIALTNTLNGHLKIKSVLGDFIHQCEKAISKIQNKQTHLQQEIEKSEKALLALADQEAAYEKKFTKLMAQLNKEMSERVKKHTQEYHSRSLPPEPISPADDLPTPLPEAVKPSVAMQSQAFFQRHKLRDYQKLIDSMEDKDKAETTLYAGDLYLTIHQTDKALALFESAIQLAMIQTIPRDDLIQGIQFALDTTRQYVEAQLIATQQHQQALLASREAKLYQLGLAALLAEGIHPGHNHELILERGKLAFKALGEAKDAQGLPKSQPTLDRWYLEKRHEVLTLSLAKTNTLIEKVNTQHGVGKNPFPPLSKLPVGLFSKNTASTTSVPAPKKSAKSSRI